MSRYCRQQKTHKKSLRIFQANVGKIAPAHDCALALADSEKYDVVLLQEPWTDWKTERCLTKTHPAYDTFSPVISWDSNDTRPRVMTYVRRECTLLTNQQQPFVTRDILWLMVNNITIVNVYRRPEHDAALNMLLRWQPPRCCVVAGDFNARHYSWQTGRPSGRGQDIASWAADNNLSLLNDVDVPTNPHGNTIDLAFTNIPLAEACVEDHLATSSDHFTLSLTLPGFSPVLEQSGKVRLTTDDEVKRFREIVETGVSGLPTSISDSEELDCLAAALVGLLQSAAKAAGRPVRKGTRSAPWWTEECAEAAAGFRAIRKIYPRGFNMDVQLAKRDFHNVVRRAKRQYWRKLIDSFTDSSSVFKAVRWLKAPGAFQPPPLQIGDTVYVTQLDKANALRQATLERRTAADDLPSSWVPSVPQRTIPFSHEILLEEARSATIGTGNTSPGSDNITVKLLQAVWDLIGTHVRRLYEGCLHVGHHPKPFREAEVVMIAKPGRRNLSTPRAWRPISLLSCLGKGLERLIARRLAWASIHHGVLHHQQAGALPKRSAVDLVTALIHDIEEAFSQKQVATLLTMDIQGAFDTVMRNRLVLRLRDQGWPSYLVGWVASFMNDRSACVRYQDTTTPVLPLQCGLPQGSPVSPILFLLYTEPLYRLGKPERRFGYADDTAILCIGNSLEETAADASKEAKELVAWGAENGISFDPEKTEVMHFSSSPKQPDTLPPVHHDTAEKRPQSAMRWLGIWLDRKLTFKTHVEKWTAKAQAVAYHLKGLANTRHGPLPKAVQRAVNACVEPVLLYGAEAWYPGASCPRWSQPSVEVSPRTKHLIHRMDKTIRQSMRSILPVWKTTPVTVLHRESGIPTVTVLLEARLIRFAARLKSLDDAHPLAKRTLPPPPTVIVKAIKRKFQLPAVHFPTRLRRTDKLLPSCPRPILIRPRFTDEASSLQTVPKKESASEFQQWLKSVSPATLIVYSVGSLSPGGAAGYGYAVHQNNRPVLKGSGRLGPAEVFDAEANGALQGLKAAISHPHAAQNEIIVCLSDLAAATSLKDTPSDSSQAVFLEFQDVAQAHGNTTIRWIPGHAKILGNKQADALAKAGRSQPAASGALPTLAYLRRVARKQPREAFDAWWTTAAPETYRSLKLKATTRCPPELATPRPVLQHLLAARSHHGDYADYHGRFKHVNARLTCSCGRRKEPKHVFYCRRILPHHRMRLTPSPATAVNRALGREFEKFVKLTEKSGFFEKICPRY